MECEFQWQKKRSTVSGVFWKKFKNKVGGRVMCQAEEEFGRELSAGETVVGRSSVCVSVGVILYGGTVGEWLREGMLGGVVGVNVEDSEGVEEESSDSEPEVDETDDVAVAARREKRSVVAFPSSSGCSSYEHLRTTSRPKWLPPGYRPTLYKGNPVYGFRMQLYCRTGYLLAIFPDKKVRGIDEDHPNALVEFSSVDFGEVRIKGLQANLYLAMNKKGRLYGEANEADEATVFVEYVYGQYNLYLSRKWAHLGWYVGIKKSGKVKPGHQTRYGQKAIQFLPRRKRYG